MFRGRGVENINKKKKTNIRKTLTNKKKKEKKKSEEYKEIRITTIKIFGFIFYIKNFIILENIILKK